MHPFDIRHLVESKDNNKNNKNEQQNAQVSDLILLPSVVDSSKLIELSFVRSVELSSASSYHLVGLMVTNVYYYK